MVAFMDNDKMIDFHADDFGISENSCNDINDLIEKGYLDSISVLPNMSSFAYAVKLFNEGKYRDRIDVTIHLNFLEGHCCANIEEIPDLVDEKGFFRISWGSLFKWNYNCLIRKKIQKQLVSEILAQTRKCIDSGIVSKENLRFDGHQHTQMIPIVFESLIDACEILKKEGCIITFIRNSQDSIGPYLRVKAIRKSFEKVNLIKCLILNFYSHRIEIKLKKNDIPIYGLCGVFFSGKMDFNRLNMVLPSIAKKAERKNQKIEVLFHPGTVLQSEISEEFVKKDFNIFHTSPNRKIEYKSISQIRNNEK